MRKINFILVVLMFATVTLFAQNKEEIVVLEEGFETTTLNQIPENWTTEGGSGGMQWGARTSSFSMSVTPHTGSMLADIWASEDSKLITPQLDLSGASSASLHFFYSLNDAGGGTVNQLKIYYKNSAGGDWTEVEHYTSEVMWAEITLDLPELSADYYIAFEGIDNAFNDGVQLDDITITKETATIILVTAINITGEGSITEITELGGTLQMEAAILPEDATNNLVTWSISAGDTYASISTEGLLTAIADGTVTVRATANDGSEVFGETDIEISNQTIGVAKINNLILVYPNPTSGFITIESSENASAKIIDILGKTVLKSEISTGKSEFDLSKFPKGIYFLKIQFKETSQTKKIILK